MAHPVVYPGDFKTLLREWDDRAKQAWKDHGKEGLDALRIANGQCARLPQELTSVGHTSRWQPGERVIDVARTLKPGTVIANFLFEYDKMWFPNSHGWHAALFIRGEGFSLTTGKPSKIVMFDQWTAIKDPKWPSPRPVYDRLGGRPSDTASEFFVVVVP
jgi:hypothetical protein